MPRQDLQGMVAHKHQESLSPVLIKTQAMTQIQYHNCSQYGIVTDNCAIAKSKPFGASHLRTEVYGYVLSHFHTQSLIQPYTQMYGWDGRNLKEHESAPPNLRKCSATRRGNRMIFFIFGLLWLLPKADNAMSG